jgi:predicted HAD superfamily Cof-like phosphohydrolase
VIHPMRSLMDDVAEFHRASSSPVGTEPQMIRGELRKRLVAEEAQEFADAVDAGDLLEAADAIADLIYVAIGSAVEWGVALDLVWDAVNKSNMAKFPGGKVYKDEHGKITKPPGWKPPDIAKAVYGTVDGA